MQFGWTKAADLRAGDVLVLVNGECVVVEWVEHEILESPVKVYNFEVEDFHTYFVGETGVLVHNDCETKSQRKNEQRRNYEAYTGKKPTGEVHHGLPEEFKDWFQSRKYTGKLNNGQKLDINSGEFYYDLPKGIHRLKSGHGIHTKNSYAGITWNKAWSNYINKNPNASAEDVLNQLEKMAKQFKISKFKAVKK